MPQRKATSALFQEINRASIYGNICIVGDFNYINTEWNYLVRDLEAERFIKVMQDNFLKQLVHEPKRGNSILDEVLCNNDKTVGEVEKVRN